MMSQYSIIIIWLYSFFFNNNYYTIITFKLIIATLKALYISDNKIESLPPEFTNLTKLETVCHNWV